MVSPILSKYTHDSARSSPRLRIVGLVAIITSITLLGWHSAASFQGLPSQVSKVSWNVETEDEELFVVLPPIEELRLYREKIRSGQPLDLAYATSLVHAATRHDDFVEVTFSENWLQWTLGRFYPPVRKLQDADRLLAHGGGNCSERSQILKTICEEGNYPSRFVGLGGHVVLEVYCDGFWQIADPDYGVHFPVELTEWQSEDSASLVRGKLARNYSSERVENYLAILHSSEDNSVLTIGQPLSPRLFMIEKGCIVGAWLLPGFGIAFGVILALWRTN